MIAAAIFMLPGTWMSYGQEPVTDANVFGHVICISCEEHLSFASVSIKGTTIGTTTDETGHYQLINIPVGTHTLRASYIGHKSKEIVITIRKGETREVNFELERDLLGLDEVVVTGERSENSRRASSVIVNTLNPGIFSATQSTTFIEGLNFSPGLRMEINCQNCGFSQVRMNGMEGPYSQILINSRPIFSGLAGVYGLELIPANMIERIEIIRGGGSVLYGSNAIAGTINLILRDPVSNSYEFGMSSGLTGLGLEDSGDPAYDHMVNFNSSLVSADNKTGMALWGFYRDRDPFDANNDEFSEIASLKNTTAGARMYHRFGTRGKLTADFFNIKEDRRGGDRFSHPVHEANIAEALNHNLTTGALTFERYFRQNDLLSAYASGQRINRGSYYGAGQSLSDYGNTRDFSFIIGSQYKIHSDRSVVTVGLENTGAWLKDEKLGYPDFANAIIVNDSVTGIPHTDNVTVADQSTHTIGGFIQYEIELKKFKLTAGARFDHYQVVDIENCDSDKSGNVLIPRIAVKYDFGTDLQLRLGYSQGYRAPQIFDEDLHIETSGSRQVIHKNSPCLKQETSHSFTASCDFSTQAGTILFSFLSEGFYTLLNDPFANQYSEPDENGTVVYTRINAENGAQVFGVNLEVNMVPWRDFNVSSGFTLQNSLYEDAQEFGERKFFRTPQDYGYLTADWQITRELGISSTLNYTGTMLVPYFGLGIPDPEEGELRKSDRFFDLGFKMRYNIKINGATLQLYTGMKNIFNSYQDDFDSGIDRDPGYIYGPANPRYIYFGLKIGNSLT